MERTWLKMIRVSKGMSMEQVGKIVGISQPSYFSIEKGKTFPRKQHAIAIAELLGFDVARFYEDVVA